MYRLFIMTFMLAVTVGCANPSAGSSSSASSPASAAPASQNNAAAANSVCDATDVQSYLGRNWSDSLDATLRRTSGSQILRTLKPGQVMTLEFSPYRLNAVINVQGVIESLYCG